MPDDDQLSPQTTETPDGVSAETPAETPAEAPAKKTTARRSATKKTTAKKAPAKKAVARKATSTTAEDEPSADDTAAESAAESTAEPAEASVQAPSAPTVTRTTRSRRTTKKAVAPEPAAPEPAAPEPPAPVDVALAPLDDAEELEPSEDEAAAATMPLFQVPEKTASARRTRKTAAQRAAETAEATASAATGTSEASDTDGEAPTGPVVKKTTRRRSTKKVAAAPQPEDETDETTATEGAPLAVETPQSRAREDAGVEPDAMDTADAESDEDDDSEQSGDGGGRRRRRRGGRRRRKSGDTEANDSGDDADSEGGATTDAASTGAAGDSRDAGGPDDADSGDDGETGGEGSSRRRRRRRRTGDGGAAEGGDDSGSSGGGGGGGQGGRGRRPRNAEDEITSVQGSTRLEAKKQRRREGREAGRRRAPIVSEAEFLARRESVERTMVVRQRDDLTQIAVLEDKVLVEHYVARESQTSLIGNVYLGRVQNVLPSMEAAFIDIGKGRNAVLYAGEVNWSALGHKDGQPRKIESVLQSGQPILVQVTKDPIGHKGARLTSQVSLAGRFLVYVPDGTTSGISRKLPDTERNRLKTLLKEIVPETAGVIVRTAAEGASEQELTTDVERLKARWEDIEAKAGGNAPQLLYGEPDLTLKVVRDLFTEDFASLVIQGDDAWDTVQGYVAHVAPDLEERLERYDVAEHTGKDVFATYRVEEQIAKGLDRKVWLPSGGSLIIDRTEAMTVVDVNTGKFTGSGGNLEETVTKNNLEAAEEMVRQLRLRDIGGIIVIDFIDMVLESNRDLVLRRLVECLGRDRTRHQVAEVTSLGLVQMTRKRIGTGLVEAFSENCTHCQGRGVVIHEQPVEPKSGVSGAEDEPRRAGRRRGGRGRNGDDQDTGGNGNGGTGGNGNGGGQGSGRSGAPSPAIVAAMARPENADAPPADGLVGEEPMPAADLEATLESVRTVESTDQPTEPAPAAETPEPTYAEPISEPEPAVVEPAVAPPAVEAAPAPEQGAGFPDAEQPEQPEPEQPEPEQPEPEQPEPEQPEPEQPEPEQPEPEQPRVVTRSRRRSASRPAGPPPGTVTPTSVVVAPDAEPAVVETGDVPVVEHVPVKRKGTRKR